MIQFAARHGLVVLQFDRLLLIAEQVGPACRWYLSRLTGAEALVGSFGSSETGTTALTCERGQLRLQMCMEYGLQRGGCRRRHRRRRTRRCATVQPSRGIATRRLAARVA
ncbi:hypothetical protein [Lentzea flava]|uniref:hypothetical protein n=1 Tax=Lentzea flava TaxID=103732 RepID=UPI00166FFD23|nr:hypothetical protein [Lentzea flava]